MRVVQTDTASGLVFPDRSLSSSRWKFRETDTLPPSALTVCIFKSLYIFAMNLFKYFWFHLRIGQYLIAERTIIKREEMVRNNRFHWVADFHWSRHNYWFWRRKKFEEWTNIVLHCNTPWWCLNFTWAFFSHNPQIPLMSLPLAFPFKCIGASHSCIPFCFPVDALLKLLMKGRLPWTFTIFVPLFKEEYPFPKVNHLYLYILQRFPRMYYAGSNENVKT